MRAIDLMHLGRPPFSHFCSSEDVSAQLDDLETRLEDWAERARELDQEQFIASVTAEIERLGEAGTLPAFTQAAAPDQLYPGLTRYWRKRVESAPVS